MKILLSLTALFAFLPFSSTPAGVASHVTASPFHCQVPCGIYGDKMRVDMMMEDLATIEKAMVYGSISEIRVPMPPFGTYFCMNTRIMIRYGFNGVMILLTESPMR